MDNTNSKDSNAIEEIDLFDYINVVYKHRKMILRNSVIAAIFIALISLVLPKTYTAQTTLFPPDEIQQNGMLNFMMGLPLTQLAFPQLSSTADLFVQVLQSRTILEQVLHSKFKINDQPEEELINILGFTSSEKARLALLNSVSISASKEGIVGIEVEMHDPQLAADVANEFVQQLDQINKEKYTSRAKNSRVYIENQLNLTEIKLKEASDSLTAFQENYKAVDLQEQTKTAIEKAGEIKGNIIAKEVQLGVALQTMKSDNVYIVQLKKEIEELKKQYNYLQFGNDIDLTKQNEFYVPFSEVPEVGLKLAYLTRDVKIQETVWELLNQQYYQAKIQETRDTPTVQVLDEAVPPEFRTSPKRMILVLVAGFLAFIISLFYAFIKEFVARINQERQQIEFIEEIKKDAASFKMYTKKKAALISQKFSKLH